MYLSNDVINFKSTVLREKIRNGDFHHNKLVGLARASISWFRTYFTRLLNYFKKLRRKELNDTLSGCKQKLTYWLTYFCVSDWLKAHT